MQKRTCPVCGLPWHSAAAEQPWRCPRCEAEIPVDAPENRWCAGCKANIRFFAEYCDGTGPEWTIAKCEAARAEARRKWREYELRRDV